LHTETDSLIFPLKDDPSIARLDSLIYLSTFQSADSRSEDEESPKVHLPEDSVLIAQLQAMDQRSPLSFGYNKHIRKYIETYAVHRTEQVERMMGLGELYFPLFEEKLDQYDVPLEVKYLAIVESALNPKARSRVGATGLWQFMYGTARIYDLKVSSYVDERSDPVRSTEAACQYLSRLYDIFEDWNLALAAYNCGPGNVNRAIRRSGGKKDYWEIWDYLPRETRGYIPAFIGAAYVMEHSDELGLKARETTISAYLVDTIAVDRLITFEELTEYLDISMDELRVLNPQYKLDIIPFVEERGYTLQLPFDKMGVFVANEDSIYNLAQERLAMREDPLPQYVEMNDRTRYRVKSGDYLGRIANQYGCSVSDIMRWNNLRSTNIRTGQYLTVYVKSVRAMEEISAREATQIADNKTEEKKKDNETGKTSDSYYIVQSGDTLWDIAKKYEGVSADQIKEWNNIGSAHRLKPGMKLVIKNI
jgi:membrane-bound lytic murein transglycosylase D